MDLPSPFDRCSNAPPSGMTLVELMVVVAIIAVLAAIGGLSYTQYLAEGKIAKLKQYAMEIQAGQEQYKSRNGYYLDISGAYFNSSSDVNEKFEQLLDFQHRNLEQLSIKVRTNAGAGGDSSCGSKVCVGGMSPDTSRAWYAISVTQDLDSSESADTTVYLDPERDQPVVLNEGK